MALRNREEFAGVIGKIEGSGRSESLATLSLGGNRRGGCVSAGFTGLSRGSPQITNFALDAPRLFFRHFPDRVQGSDQLVWHHS